MRKITLTVSSLLVLLASTFAAGAQPGADPGYQTRTYTVRKGDTLWSIATGQLSHPFQWPLVWKENGIKNPDLIYPGEKIKIPLQYAKPIVEENYATAPAPAPVPAPAPAAPATNAAAIAPQPAPKQYVFTANDLLSCGYLTKTVLREGRLESAVSGRRIITEGDDAYLDLKSPASPFQKFIIADVQSIEDPVTGKTWYQVTQLGIAQEKRSQGSMARATIIKVFGRIAPGDVVLAYNKPAPVEAGPAPKPDVSTHVVAFKKPMSFGAQGDVVYLDKGILGGLQPGDEVQTLFGPDPNGLLRVMVVTADTATAMVEKSVKPISPGDKVTGIK